MRPSRDECALQMAYITAVRSTCLRRHVGCVLLNKRGQVLSTGYNGVAAGMPHCNEKGKIFGESEYPYACGGAESPSGTDLDSCQAIHAEQNALLQCRNIYEIDTCYVTASPCITCTKLLLNTNCRQIYFKEDYPQPAAQELWTKAGRIWTKA